MARRWRFGIRSLLLLTLASGCVFAIWRWQVQQRQDRMIRSLSQQQGLLGIDHERKGGEAAFVRRFHIAQLVRHRSFRSSGLQARMRATDDGFGDLQLLFTNVAEFEIANRKQVCLTFVDQSGSRREVIVVFTPNGDELSWMEVGAAGETSWSTKLENSSPSDGDDIPTASVIVQAPGQLSRNTYRLTAAKIELIKSELLVDTATREAELLRAMQIDRQAAPVPLRALEGPESDLR